MMTVGSTDDALADDDERPETLPQSVHRRLVRLIRSGELSLGQRMDEATLASQLRVSRTPLREAIRRLVSEGVVEHRPYQGHFVRTFSVKQVDDLYEYRKALEELALQQVARSHVPEDLAPLAAVVAESALCLQSGDLAGFEAADRAFHSWIAAASTNEMVIKSLGDIELQIQLLRQVANQVDEFREESQAQREGIVAALSRGDGEEAARLMHEHIGAAQAAAVSTLHAHLVAESG